MQFTRNGVFIMATLSELYSIYQPNGELYKRFEAASVKTACAVLNESEATENHANRLAFAKKVLLNPRQYAQQYFRLWMSNTTVQTNGDATTDSDIEYVVATQFWDLISNLEAA